MVEIYKFRVLSEDNDEFVRDIEIKSSQTFKDLHDAFLKSVSLDGRELASFFTSNESWDKNHEITLIDMTGDPDNDSDEDEEPATSIMDNTKLSDFIDLDNNRLLYEYDFLNIKTFKFELLATSEVEKGVKYPRVTWNVSDVYDSSFEEDYMEDTEEEEEYAEENDEDLRDELLREFDDLVKGDYDDDDDDGRYY